MRYVGPALFVLAVFSLFFFPRLLTLALALSAAPFVPAAPLAVGILADVLYAPAGLHALPFYTLLGGAACGVAFAVRARIVTAMMD